ncbi:hypothetical protein EJ02DRAFT_417338 [Clathrospora elynae]|uniref:Uncharacterized protein n=1 Tax=Clathrospora elynae TaxID=706981 RepID=A0A6A5TAR2_9PLEO|nr:hypothetical protein EJ02DRAFT_417338 [Clathrospora elynae]
MFEFLSLFSFLISYEFWSRVCFFISYILTFLLVLEVVRLASTDANRKEVEKMLDSYASSRSRSETRRPGQDMTTVKVSIDELDAEMERRSVTPERQRTRTPSPAVTLSPESEKTLAHEESRRRRRADSGVQPFAAPTSISAAQPQIQTQTPPRRLRKRSDTLTSTSSADSKTSLRRRREASPAESKTSARHASPTPRSRSKETKILGTSLGKMLRSRG